MQVILINGFSITSNLIKWQTDGLYSHAGILFSDGAIIESYPGDGVRAIYGYQFPYPKSTVEIYDFNVKVNEYSARQFAEQQVGKKYDWPLIFRFLSRDQNTRTNNGKWFCSELAFVLALKGGVTLLERIQPFKVDPVDISLSTLLNFNRRFTIN